MRTVSLETFKINVPENSEESYQTFGNVPKEAKRICEIMNIKKTIVDARVFANMIAGAIGQKVKSIQ